MVETAQQTFAKTADKLKEMYADLLVIADHQFKQIEAANHILDEYQAKFPYAATTTIELVNKLRLCFSQGEMTK